MKRYSKAFLEKHPELKGKDLEITKAACEVQAHPGDRGELPGRHAFQRAEEGPATVALSPPAQAQGRRGGLRPRRAGRATDALLDVTVVYPSDKVPGFWDLLCGRVPKVIVDIRPARSIPPCGRATTRTTRCSASTCRNGSRACGKKGRTHRPLAATALKYRPKHTHLVGRITATRLSAVSTAQRRITPGALFALPVRATNTRGRTHS